MLLVELLVGLLVELLVEPHDDLWDPGPLHDFQMAVNHGIRKTT